jgi:two-component system, NtrC family, sensor kinase
MVMKNLLSHWHISFPLRFKILIALLCVVTIAVSVITFTMAGLFHDDKKTYIHDLTSVIALHVASEGNALLQGYREKLLVVSRLMTERGLTSEQKAGLIKNFFEDFREFVLITRYNERGEAITVYDAKAIADAGLTKEAFTEHFRTHPLPLDQIRDGRTFIENSTISKKLPIFTLAVAAPSDEKDINKPVIAAVVKLNGLLKLAGRTKVFETFVIDANGGILAHSDPDKVNSRSPVSSIPEFGKLKTSQSMVTTAEYTQAGLDMVGGFSWIDFGGLVAAVQIPKSTAYLTAKEIFMYLLVVCLILLTGSALVSLFWSGKLTKPIERLSRVTERVGQGDFNIHIEPSSADEIGELARSVNHMASELKIRETALKEAHAQLIQSEKMAAFGQLGAGIAHEVKNPLAGILGYAQLSLRKLEEGNQLYNNIKVIEKETKRCKTIIDNLLKFSRQERVEHVLTDINSVVEDAAAIVDHQLGINQVRLEKKIGQDLSQVLGNSNQIQQVLMNIIINANQAMEGKPGVITVETLRPDPEHVEIRISDDGPGIPKEVQSKIFEPFFTTKPVGKGTGLGLSVSYGIIKDHGGNISVESEIGKGTLFIISLPVGTVVEKAKV